MTLELRLYDSDARTLLGTLTKDSARSWLDQFKEVGSSSFALPLDDAAGEWLDLITYRWVKFYLDGVARWSQRIEKRELALRSEGEEATDLVVYTGPGPLATWQEAIVFPHARMRSLEPEATERFFHYGSDDYHLWTSWPNAVEVDRQGDPSSFYGRLIPAEWPDPDAMWIWSQVPDYGVTPPDPATPVGDVYFVTEVTIADDGEYQFFFTGDDGVEVWLDGVFMAAQGGKPGDWFTHLRCYTFRRTLLAGTHRIAAKCTNVVFEPSDGNIGTFLLSMYSTLGDTLNLLVLHTDSTWKALGYPPAQPTLNMGQIIRVLLDEAHARGALPMWTLAFTDVFDSSEVDWPSGANVAVRIGGSYLDVLRLLGETYISFEVDHDEMRLFGYGTPDYIEATSIELQVGNPTQGTVTDAPGDGGLASLTRTEIPAFATAALVRTGDGNYLRSEATGDDVPDQVIEVYVEAGSAPDEAAAEVVAQQMFQARASVPTATLSFEVSQTPGKELYEDWRVGSRVLLPDSEYADFGLEDSVVRQVTVSDVEDDGTVGGRQTIVGEAVQNSKLPIIVVPGPDCFTWLDDHYATNITALDPYCGVTNIIVSGGELIFLTGTEYPGGGGGGPLTWARALEANAQGTGSAGINFGAAVFGDLIVLCAYGSHYGATLTCSDTAMQANAISVFSDSVTGLVIFWKYASGSEGVITVTSSNGAANVEIDGQAWAGPAPLPLDDSDVITAEGFGFSASVGPITDSVGNELVVAAVAHGGDATAGAAFTGMFNPPDHVSPLGRLHVGTAVTGAAGSVSTVDSWTSEALPYLWAIVGFKAGTGAGDAPAASQIDVCLNPVADDQVLISGSFRVNVLPAVTGAIEILVTGATDQYLAAVRTNKVTLYNGSTTQQDLAFVLELGDIYGFELLIDTTAGTATFKVWNITDSETSLTGSTVTHTGTTADIDHVLARVGDDSDVHFQTFTVDNNCSGVLVPDPGFVSITSVVPPTRPQGYSGDVTVLGTGFLPGVVATFSGTGITVNSTTYVSANEATVNIDIDGAATISTRTVTITNTDLSSDICTCFDVTAAIAPSGDKYERWGWSVAAIGPAKDGSYGNALDDEIMPGSQQTRWRAAWNDWTPAGSNQMLQYWDDFSEPGQPLEDKKPVFYIRMGFFGASLATVASGAQSADYVSFGARLQQLVDTGKVVAPIVQVGNEFSIEFGFNYSIRSDHSLDAVFVAAYRRIVDDIRSQCPTARFSLPVYPVFYDWTGAYPGDAYVDILDTHPYDTNATAKAGPGIYDPPSDQAANVRYHWSFSTASGSFQPFSTTEPYIGSPGGIWNFAIAHGKKFGCSESGVAAVQTCPHLGGGDDPGFVDMLIDLVDGTATGAAGVPDDFVEFIVYFHENSDVDFCSNGSGFMDHHIVFDAYTFPHPFPDSKAEAIARFA